MMLPAATVCAVSILLAGVGGRAGETPEPSAAPSGRVIVLGFDGADARTIRELVAAHPGAYPAFETLASTGTFAPLLVEIPPESPTSWASLNTGQNPAKTGVPGFMKRHYVGDAPMPTFGHIDPDQVQGVGAFENTPIPTWTPATFAAVSGACGFLFGLLLGVLLFRKRLSLALAVALLCGGASAFGGRTLRSWLPDTYTRTSNPNHARNVWDYAAEAGARSIALDAAAAFDMETPAGADVLWGLGIPDARNGIGEWSIYTTNPEVVSRALGGEPTSTAGTLFRVDEYGGEIQTKIYGPENWFAIERLQEEIAALTKEKEDPDTAIPRQVTLNNEIGELRGQKADLESNKTGVDLTIQKVEGKALITVGSQTQELSEGEWSDWFELEFVISRLVSVHAITRMRLNSLENPYFELYVNVLDIDPREPPFWQAISAPFDYAPRLAENCGLFETYGWPTATMPFKDEMVPPELLLEDVEFTETWRERLTLHELARDDWRFLWSVFSTPDRVQHMMYKYYDSGHPFHDAAVADRTLSFFGETIAIKESIPAIYRKMDSIIGKVLAEHVGAEDTLFVISDHGFQSFRYQVHVNNLLKELGYLVLKPGITKSEAGGFGFPYVDWTKTRAYSLGMGFIYLNLLGREPNGIVKPSEADALVKEIKSKLLEVVDPRHPEVKIVRDVYVTKEIHNGPEIGLESDLILGFAPPYRVSWRSTSGGLSMVDDDLGLPQVAEITSDNDSNWSGDHVSMAQADVAGVFFCNRNVEIPATGVRALQIAPTVLSLLGVAVPAEMDMAPLVVR